MLIENGRAYLSRFEQRVAERVVDSRVRFTGSSLALVLAYLETAPATNEAEHWQEVENAAKASLRSQARYLADLDGLIERERRDGRHDCAEWLQQIRDIDSEWEPI